MFKKPTKKQFLIRRIMLSALATFSVLIIVTFSILFMLGYRLDSGNGRLEQGALLQFNSTPDAAQVWVDGQYINAQTATKQTVIAGTHSVKYTKNGYEDWNRTLSLDAGTLTWLDYIRLVPQNRPIEVVGQYNNLAGMQFSPDLKWALGQEVASKPTFRLIDLRSTEVKTTFLSIDPEVYSESDIPESSHQFSIYRWSSAGRYAVIKHVYGDSKTEWLLLDTQDISKTINITRALNVDLADLQFATTSGMSLFGLTSDNVVRKLDLSGGTISRGLITNVKNFSVFEETSVVSYVGLDPAESAKSVAGIYKDGDSASRVLRAANGADAALKIAVTRYFGEDFVAISEGSAVDVLTGSLPNATQESSGMRKYAQFGLGSNVTSLSFSPKGDFVLAQAGAGFTSYELEHLRSASGTVDVKDNQEASTLKWLDTAHLWNDDDNSLIMRDFDGTNAHSIMKVERGFGASISQNGRYFYAVGKVEDGRYQLQRVRMILN